MTNYVIAILAFALLALAAYVWYRFRSLKADMALEKVDTARAYAGLTDLVTALNAERKKQIAELAATTPRYTVNAQNEAVLTSPDGAEIYNVHLNKKR